MTTLGLETACGQIEYIEINYDAHTNVTRPHAGRAHVVRFTQANLTMYGLTVWHIFLFFKNVDILLKNATEIGVVRKLSVQNLEHVQSTQSTRPLADCTQA